MDSECPLVRVPAGDIDRIIIKKVGEILCSPIFLAETNRSIQEYYNNRKAELQKQLKEVSVEFNKLRKNISKSNISQDEMKRQLEQFKGVENKRKVLEEAIRESGQEVSCRSIANALGSLETIWEELFPAERYRLAHLLINKITLYEDKMILDVKTHGIKSLAQEVEAGAKQTNSNENLGIISLTIPVQLRHRGNRRIMLMPGETEEDSTGDSPLNEVLIRALSKAHLWNGMLENGKVLSISELARKVNFDRTYVGRILNLVNLSPKLQEAIINGKEPDGLNLKKLRNDLPFDWREQEGMFFNSDNQIWENGIPALITKSR